ncbi:MAG: hypothetical protein M9887_11095 [Chitinophagales bacterium]|nr:hypothetical protein [Chitinophagales bacterium]
MEQKNAEKTHRTLSMPKCQGADVPISLRFNHRVHKVFHSSEFLGTEERNPESFRFRIHGAHFGQGNALDIDDSSISAGYYKVCS